MLIAADAVPIRVVVPLSIRQPCPFWIFFGFFLGGGGHRSLLPGCGGGAGEMMVSRYSLSLSLSREGSGRVFVEKPGRAGPFFCDPGWWSEMELVVWEREGCSVAGWGVDGIYVYI